MSEQTIRVAAAQFPASNNIEDNKNHITSLMQQAGDAGVELVVFPEASMCAFGSPLEELQKVAQKNTAGFIEFMQGLATQHKCNIVVGVMCPPEDEASDPRVRNELIRIDEEGVVQERYCKVHLYDAFKFKESDKVKPGEITEDHQELAIFNLSGFEIGLINCYDLRFPEMTRLLIDRGVEIISLSAAWLAGPHKENHWEILARARAIENTAYVIASGQTPPKNCGMSMVIDPMGVVLAGGAEAPAIAVADICQKRVDSVRKTLPCLENRRYRSAK